MKYLWKVSYIINDEIYRIKQYESSSVFEQKPWMPNLENLEYSFEIIDVTGQATLEECHKNRIELYGSIADQLDEIYHDYDAWKARITAVKAQFPKPE